MPAILQWPFKNLAELSEFFNERVKNNGVILQATTLIKAFEFITTDGVAFSSLRWLAQPETNSCKRDFTVVVSAAVRARSAP